MNKTYNRQLVADMQRWLIQPMIAVSCLIAVLVLAGSCAAAELIGVAARASDPAEGVLLVTQSANGVVPVKSWKTLRDERIVKQDLDYSCGAASLVTLLNSFYGQHVTEEALLNAMDKGDGWASFEDMARILPQFGFRAQGFAASWEQLAQLKMPVIVYVKHRKDDHFSVLRGISENTVWLADPSLGNRTYSREQFLSMWQTRTDADDGLIGKFLAVLPDKATVSSPNDFFTTIPRRQSANATEQLALRTLR